MSNCTYTINENAQLQLVNKNTPNKMVQVVEWNTTK